MQGGKLYSFLVDALDPNSPQRAFTHLLSKSLWGTSRVLSVTRFCLIQCMACSRVPPLLLSLLQVLTGRCYASYLPERRSVSRMAVGTMSHQLGMWSAIQQSLPPVSSFRNPGSPQAERLFEASLGNMRCNLRTIAVFP